jgi:hypothetical protein
MYNAQLNGHVKCGIASGQIKSLDSCYSGHVYYDVPRLAEIICVVLCASGGFTGGGRWGQWHNCCSLVEYRIQGCYVIAAICVDNVIVIIHAVTRVLRVYLYVMCSM